MCVKINKVDRGRCRYRYRWRCVRRRKRLQTRHATRDTGTDFSIEGLKPHDEMEKGDRREPRRCDAGSTDVKDDDERDDDGDDGVDSPPCIPG
jgi:hypothetical protein